MKFRLKILQLLTIFLVSLCPVFLSKDFDNIFVQEVYADTTTLGITQCYFNGTLDTTCLSAVSADGGTATTFTKNQDISLAFQTIDVGSVTSATLYYDASGTLSGSWAVYVQDSNGGNTLCSVDPAPENSNETRNSLSCSITPTQLSNGVWFYAINNDGAGPEDINIDYVYISLEYTPALSISITSDGSVSFGTQDLNTTVDTTATGLNDIEIVSVDSGPVNLDIRSTVFTDSSNNWSYGSSNGSDQVKFEFSNNGSSWTNILLADTLYTFDTNVAQGNTRNIYFRLTTPTSTTSYLQYGTTITIVASAP